MTQSRRARIATTVLEIVFLGLGYRCLKGQALCNIDDYFYADGTSGVTDAAGFSTIMEYPLFLCEVGAFVEGRKVDCSLVDNGHEGVDLHPLVGAFRTYGSVA